MTLVARPRSVPARPAGGGPAVRCRIRELDMTGAPDPIALFGAALARGEDTTLWLAPDGGPRMVAVGAAWSIRSFGRGRFADVSRAWSGLVAGAEVDGPRGAPCTGPLLLGGFGFADDAATTPVWRGFETASLALPRVLLTVDTSRAWLTTSAVATGDELDAADDLWRQLTLAAVPAATRPSGRPAGLRVIGEVPGAVEWQTAVARLAGAVGRGRLDKVVLARRLDLEATDAVDLTAVLRRLAASAPESTVFAVTRGVRAFVGATPETLVRAVGRDFSTMAMAGSAGRGAEPEGDDTLAAALIASEKEREEHRVVVEMLRETLAPLADALSIPAVPNVRRLAHVQHLVTGIDGHLREPLGVLSLAERLHPTPAVGGTPRDLALELIAEQERIERGWYAGPVGWVDAQGDGEFAVAIRSGVVEGREASLFAGCGIVADSDPAREWEESVQKLRALASALGVVDSR